MSVRAFSRGETVLTEVRDDGAGIPAELLPHVWDGYFTASQQKRKKRGSGLGLAICREILDAHGCAYGVESEEGKGNMFWFEMRGR